jgi:long-chain acyl-CoA synthetase
MSTGTATGSAPTAGVTSGGAPPQSGPQTLGQLVLGAAARYRGTALQSTRSGEQAEISYPEFGRIVTEIARGLIAIGIQAGDRVAILGSTSADWTLADYGALCAGAVVTPIYHTNSPQECAYVLAHSGSRLVFCGVHAHPRERCRDSPDVRRAARYR